MNSFTLKVKERQLRRLTYALQQLLSSRPPADVSRSATACPFTAPAASITARPAPHLKQATATGQPGPKRPLTTRREGERLRRLWIHVGSVQFCQQIWIIRVHDSRVGYSSCTTLATPTGPSDRLYLFSFYAPPPLKNAARGILYSVLSVCECATECVSLCVPIILRTPYLKTVKGISPNFGCIWVRRCAD